MPDDLAYAAVVNQKLAFARIELRAAEASEGDDIEVRLKRHAHLDGAVGQLAGAARYLVAELAEQHDMALSVSEESLSGLVSRLTGWQHLPAALAHVRESLLQAELSGLLEASRDPLYLARRFRDEHGGADEMPADRIAAVSVAEPEPRREVAAWAAALQNLVDHLRSSLHEE